MCTINTTVLDCTSGMTTEAFLTYTEFLTHTDNICFYLQSEVWRAATASVVDKLHAAADATAERLKAHVMSQVGFTFQAVVLAWGYQRNDSVRAKHGCATRKNCFATRNSR